MAQINPDQAKSGVQFQEAIEYAVPPKTGVGKVREKLIRHGTNADN